MRKGIIMRVKTNIEYNGCVYEKVCLDELSN